jgi:hypothetical protein
MLRIAGRTMRPPAAFAAILREAGLRLLLRMRVVYVAAFLQGDYQ